MKRDCRFPTPIIRPLLRQWRRSSSTRFASSCLQRQRERCLPATGATRSWSTHCALCRHTLKARLLSHAYSISCLALLRPASIFFAHSQQATQKGAVVTKKYEPARSSQEGPSEWMPTESRWLHCVVRVHVLFLTVKSFSSCKTALRISEVPSLAGLAAVDSLIKSLALNEIASLKRSKQRDGSCYDTKQGEDVAKRRHRAKAKGATRTPYLAFVHAQRGGFQKRGKKGGQEWNLRENSCIDIVYRYSV